MRIVARQSPRRLTVDQQAQLDRAAKELALFTRLQPTAKVERAAPLMPGSKAFVTAAKYDYQTMVAHYGKAQLPAAFRVRTLDAEVLSTVKTFAALHRGSPEVALNTIDGQRSFQVQVPVKDRTHVLLLDGRGHELARGEVKGARVSWQW